MVDLIPLVLTALICVAPALTALGGMTVAFARFGAVRDVGPDWTRPRRR